MIPSSGSKVPTTEDDSLMKFPPEEGRRILWIEFEGRVGDRKGEDDDNSIQDPIAVFEGARRSLS